LLSLAAPPDRRPYLWALYLFNHEIARVRETVTDTTLGLIRLQWWHDRLGPVFDGQTHVAKDHPALPLLAEAIAQFKLPRVDFETLLYAREFDLADVPPANLEGLVNYADFTNTALMRLSLLIAGQDAEHAALAGISIAYGLTGIARAVPFHAKAGRCLLPEDRLKEAGIKISDMLAGKFDDAMPGVIGAVCEEASRQLDIARDNGTPPPLLRGARRMVGLYLKRLEKSRYDVRNGTFYARPAFLGARVAFAII
jgi:phytoene synthase